MNNSNGRFTLQNNTSMLKVLTVFKQIGFCIALPFLFTGLITPLLAPSPIPVTTAFRRAVIYAGPGDTFQQTGFLNPGLEIRVVERNQTGIWVRIQRVDEAENVVQDGWVISAYLNRDTDLQFSSIPVNSTLLDSQPSNVNSQSMAKLYQAPILPIISDEMIKIFNLGQSLGNQSDVITKVGDSLSASNQYLIPLANARRELGPYDYLAPALDFYTRAGITDSVAARIGLSTYAVFDPLWADKEQCQPNESPLNCEYRLKKPAISFLMFGPNDVRSMTEDKYETQMRSLIEATLAHGIIPVISTFSAHPDEEFFWQSINFNLKLVALTEEYQTPLINLWAAARILPDFGLDQDKVHLKVSGFDYLKYDTGHEAFYGVSLHNLLSICVLNQIYEKLNVEVNE